MENSLQQLVPQGLAEFFISAGLEAALPKVAEQTVKAVSRFLHPDVTVSTGLKLSDVELREQFLSALQNSLADIRDPDGLTLAIEELNTPEFRRRLSEQRADTRQQQLQSRALSATLSLLGNVDQFRVLGLDGPTSFLLEHLHERLILNVMSHERASLSVSGSGSEELPLQAEKPVYVDGKWTEVYFDSSDATQTVEYVHKPENIGRVTVIGFLSADAIRQQNSMSSLAGFAETELALGEGLPSSGRSIPWTFISEAWFMPYVTPVYHPGDEVVALKNQDLVAHIGTIAASAPQSRATS